MMFKTKIIFWLVLFILLNTITVLADQNSSYVLVYDHLYKYAEKSSDILHQYRELKSAGQDVLLVQIDNFDLKKIKEDSIILIAAASFDSADEYQQILALKKYKVMTIKNNQLISSEEKSENKGLMIAIDRVYPFSDLNKLMDMAEFLHGRGIDFIVTIMPVYDNYQLKAFDTYLSVLRYVNKMGGHLFVHYPLENKDVRYDNDPGFGLKKAVIEYRKNGLEINGITLSQDKLFTGLKVFESLELPFILTTKSERKIQNKLDLQGVSKELNKYIVINGISINNFDFFNYKKNKDALGLQSVNISLSDDQEKLISFLKIFNRERIPIKDFKIQNYYKKIKDYNYTKTENIEGLEDKSQYEKFLDEEMKKIRGENLEEQQEVGGYDISWFTKTGVKIVFIIIIFLIVQVLIGRRSDIKKYFKD